MKLTTILNRASRILEKQEERGIYLRGVLADTVPDPVNGRARQCYCAEGAIARAAGIPFKLLRCRGFMYSGMWGSEEMPGNLEVQTELALRALALVDDGKATPLHDAYDKGHRWSCIARLRDTAKKEKAIGH